MTERDGLDERLRTAFAELRAADERDAPSFEALVAGRPPRRAQARSYRPPLVIAAGLLIVAGVAYRSITARSGRLTVPNEVVALSAWRASTDVLLDTPGKSLFTEVPRLGASLVDTGITGGIR